ncbi:pilin [Pseudonocardia alni]|uniref:pilin n=1 Tax=Pseudonocardia alni TaxID=33907 RepID=UPI0033D2C694
MVLLAVVLVCALLLPGGGTAWAAGVVPVQAPAPAASVEQVLTNLRNWVMGIVGVLATVCFTIGAVRYMAAAGDMGEVEKAKTAFRSAAFGYAIVVLAPLLVSVLSGIVGA